MSWRFTPPAALSARLSRVPGGVCGAPVRLSLFCAALGVALGAVAIGPLDVLVAGPAALASAAVVFAAAFCGRGLGSAVAVRGQAQDELADDDGNDVAEGRGLARGNGED